KLFSHARVSCNWLKVFLSVLFALINSSQPKPVPRELSGKRTHHGSGRTVLAQVDSQSQPTCCSVDRIIIWTHGFASAAYVCPPVMTMAVSTEVQWLQPGNASWRLAKSSHDKACQGTWFSFRIVPPTQIGRA